MKPKLKTGYTKNGIRYIGYQQRPLGNYLREYCPFIKMTNIYSLYGDGVCVGSGACQECEFFIDRKKDTDNYDNSDWMKCKLFQIQERAKPETIIEY